ncbi:unnamed protein product [Soboliphyme baturini]|uniref:Coiled-coil domain-containing protein 172 n=1 Tax=Soboliphyme baturini TaxID=241478 RepID=A0A183IM83_9BILA|nr:unnamed protein product [Soboliphyme baturini]
MGFMILLVSEEKSKILVSKEVEVATIQPEHTRVAEEFHSAESLAKELALRCHKMKSQVMHQMHVKSLNESLKRLSVKTGKSEEKTWKLRESANKKLTRYNNDYENLVSQYDAEEIRFDTTVKRQDLKMEKLCTERDHKVSQESSVLMRLY